MSDVEWEDGFKFEVLARDPNSRARLGQLTTPHGVISTPAFMPVGTYGAVKGISPEELRSAGAQIVLSNALHLEFRPGSDLVAQLGGLHRLMAWDGPILTDSGGFQTFSLSNLMHQNEEGIEVKSPINGSNYTFSPESVIQIQRQLGTDFMMPLDVCPPGNSDYKTAAAAVETTLRWASLSRETYQNSKPEYGKAQALFGIVQGSAYKELRLRAIESLGDIGFFAYALGGLAVGESKENTWRTVQFCDAHLPQDQLRYLMGAGTPEDLRMAISLGMDFFDCVLPTRNGRKGSLFVKDGKMNLRNAAFKDDPSRIEEGCNCYACQSTEDGRPRFSRGATRHLLYTGDPLGARLGALHNLTHYLRLLESIRNDLERQAQAPESSPSGG
jgi:queuine tRNA-ribosyltransferase